TGAAGAENAVDRTSATFFGSSSICRNPAGSPAVGEASAVFSAAGRDWSDPAGPNGPLGSDAAGGSAESSESSASAESSESAPASSSEAVLHGIEPAAAGPRDASS